MTTDNHTADQPAAKDETVQLPQETGQRPAADPVPEEPASEVPASKEQASVDAATSDGVARAAETPELEVAQAASDVGSSPPPASESNDVTEESPVESTSQQRRLRLNPTVAADVLKPIPSVSPSVAQPDVAQPNDTQPGDVPPASETTQESDASAVPQESAASPASASVDAPSDVEDTGSAAASSAPPTEPIELPAKNEALDADLEAELEAALAGDQESDAAVAEVADALEQPAAASVKPDLDLDVEPGTRLKGTVQSIHGDDMFIDFGLRNAGVLSRRQFGLRKQPMQGEPIEVIVSRIDETEGLIHVNLPSSASRIRGNWDEISVDQIVECVVNQTNKGGLEVSVGSLRGFMPASQVELGYVADLTSYVGQKLRAHVAEVNPKRRKLVLSRRKLLEGEREVTEKAFFEKLAPGQTYEGCVKTIKDYGAFVDIGGVDGLLHVGQISWSRINHPNEVLTQGQQIEVQVLSVDEEKKKISLGMRQLTQNPWKMAEEKFESGTIAKGKVTRIEGFGAFVELEPGMEGLVHISELDHKRVKSVNEVLRVGQEVDVQILEVNPSRKRISLSLKALKEKPEEAATPEDLAPIQRHRSPESLKGGIGEPTGGKLFGDPTKFGG